MFDKTFKELIKGSASVFLIRFLAMFTSYTFTFLVSRLYGATGMGYFALSQTLLMMFSVLSRLGLDSAIVKYVSQASINKQSIKMRAVYIKMLKLIIFTGSIITFILFILSSFLAKNIMRDPNLEYIIQITSFFIIPFALLFFHSECFRGLKKMIHYSIFRNMTPMFLASIILLVYFYNSKINIMHPIYSYLISILVLSLISFMFWFLHLPKINKNHHISTISIKELLSTSLPMLLTSSIFFLFYWVTMLFLSIYCTPDQIGIYDVTFKISLIISIALFAASGIAAPNIAQLYANNKLVELNDTIKKTTRISSFIAIPIFLFILIFHPFILNIFGSEFIVGKWCLIFLSIGQFVHCISGPVMNIFQMTGREKIFQKIVVNTLLVNILMSIILIPQFELIGAAISNMMSMILWNIISVFYIKKDFNILTINIFKQ